MIVTKRRIIEDCGYKSKILLYFVVGIIPLALLTDMVPIMKSGDKEGIIMIGIIPFLFMATSAKFILENLIKINKIRKNKFFIVERKVKQKDIRSAAPTSQDNDNFWIILDNGEKIRMTYKKYKEFKADSKAYVVYLKGETKAVAVYNKGRCILVEELADLVCKADMEN